MGNWEWGMRVAGMLSVATHQHAAGLALRSDVEIQEAVAGGNVARGDDRQRAGRIGRSIVQRRKESAVLQGPRASDQFDHAAAGAEIAKNSWPP